MFRSHLPITITNRLRASRSFSTATSLKQRPLRRLRQTNATSPTAPTRRHFSPSLFKSVQITYIEADGTEKVVEGEVGQNLLEIAHDNNVELEGACGGELACSTCHLIFEEDMYQTLPEKDEEEDDMLDLAFEVTETSRLGCQILLREDMEGMKVQIPDDGF